MADIPSIALPVVTGGGGTLVGGRFARITSEGMGRSEGEACW
jgi:hypothetical protein